MAPVRRGQSIFPFSMMRQAGSSVTIPLATYWLRMVIRLTMGIMFLNFRSRLETTFSKVVRVVIISVAAVVMICCLGVPILTPWRVVAATICSMAVRGVICCGVIRQIKLVPGMTSFMAVLVTTSSRVQVVTTRCTGKMIMICCLVRVVKTA